MAFIMNQNIILKYNIVTINVRRKIDIFINIYNGNFPLIIFLK